MNAVQNFASHNFATYALKNIRIDEDANGLIALVPDQSGRWMTVRCEESATEVVPTSCSCGKADCKHQAVVSSYYGKLYKVEAPKVAKTRKPRNGLVRKVRNGGLVRVEQPAPIAKVIEQAVEAKVPDMMKAALTTNQGFRIMR